MSHESVEIVQSHIEAYARQDVSRALSFLDQGVVFDAARVGVHDDVAFGHAAVAETVARFTGAFEDYSYEVERLNDLGSGSVVAVAAEAGSGKGSGVPVRRPLALLYHVIDGKIARITVFPDERQALSAVGKI
jgi:ketosteroid isomerase-like protein